MLCHVKNVVRAASQTLRMHDALVCKLLYIIQQFRVYYNWNLRVVRPQGSIYPKV